MQRTRLIVAMPAFFSAALFAVPCAFSQTVELRIIYVGNDVIDFTVEAQFDARTFAARLFKDGALYSSDALAWNYKTNRDSGLGQGELHCYTVKLLRLQDNSKAQASEDSATTGEVRGNITQNTIWEGAIHLLREDPVLRNGDNVLIAPGATLTIRSGTVIETSDDQTRLEVLGQLNVLSGVLFRGRKGSEALELAGSQNELRNLIFTNLSSVNLNLGIRRHSLLPLRTNAGPTDQPLVRV